MQTDDQDLEARFLRAKEAVTMIINNSSSAEVTRFLKTHNLADFPPELNKENEKGKLLFSLLKRHVIEPQVLKNYFVRLPYYIDPLGQTACHFLGRFNHWPDVWKPMFIQLYLEDNIKAIDHVDRAGRTIIECFCGSIRVYIARNVTLRKISHYMWMSLKCSGFILSRVSPNIRRLVLMKYV
jgi:hypothetical protein